MKRFGLLLCMCIFLPTSVCQAENAGLAGHSVEIPNIFAKLTLHQGPLQEVKIHHPPLPPANKAFSLIKTAEAFVQPNEVTFRNFEVICNKVNDARQIDDLTRLLSGKSLQLLEQATSQGASEQVMLTMIRTSRPQDIHVIDAAINHNRATLSVTGQSSFGPMNGIVHMISEKGTWKIDREEWYAGYISYTEIYNPLSVTASQEPQIHRGPYAKGLFSKYAPDYKMKRRKILSLTKVPYTKDKQAFTLIFVLNKTKHGPKRSDLTRYREEYGLIEKPRPYVHLMWTGSKKILRNQHLIKDQYPMDVSIAPADEGFAAGEWNVILPKKRPQGARIAFMWAF